MRSGAPRRTDERALIAERRSREVVLTPALQTASFALAYPSPYRAGMSSLGFQSLYRQLNAAGIGTHRVFLPDAWEALALRWPQQKRPILSYEAERPLSSYPVIGLSIAYELEIAGVIRLLEGAGIPVLAASRGPRDPIVIGGGPLTFSNPSVALPFVDLLLVGEAEARLPELLATIEAAGGDRRRAIEAAGALDNVVVGEIDEGRFEPLPAPARATKELLPAHSAILTPDTELAEMFLVEPERGCSRRCTFCVMRGGTVAGGMRILPKERPLSVLPPEAKRVGLVGAAVTDLPHLEELVADIVDSGRGVAISSLRADRLTPRFLHDLQRGGYRTITVASDGISERMRLVLDRRVKEQDLLRAATLTAEAGFHKLKVYEMIGAPGETDADVDELIRFARELAAIQRLTLTFSTFVAKRNTPLDGQPFLGVKEAEARLQRIRGGLRGKVELRPQSPRWAYVEYLLAQWGPESGHAALRAVHAGGRYADWIRAFKETPHEPRTLRFGDEEARARRRGFAAESRPRLPVLSNPPP
ncbi:MAG: radical SAM protein [Nannocystaceae bacterium]